MAMDPTTARSLTNLTADLVLELSDTDSKYSDDDKTKAINQARLVISLYVPYEFTDTLETDGTYFLDGSDLLPTLLPVNPIVKMEYPDNYFYQVKIFGTSIEMPICPDSGEDITLYCRGIHSVSDAASTLSYLLEPILVKMAAGLAAMSKAQAYIAKATESGNVNNATMNWGKAKYNEALHDLRGIRKIESKSFER